MILLAVTIGWGLVAFSLIGHLWHHDRLRLLLSRHIDNDRGGAAALTALEIAVVIAVPVSLATGRYATPIAIAGLLLAVGFGAWVLRLVLSDSTLPCACSYSDAPPSWWSVARAVLVGLIGLIVISEPAESSSLTVATFVVGAAVGAALFLLPDAMSWPTTSRAALARLDAHAPTTARRT